MSKNVQVVLSEIPSTKLAPSNFAVRDAEVPTASAGQVYQGLETAPQAFVDLLAGRTTGTTIVTI